MLAGYLGHEDPRIRPALEHGTWNRTKAALASVLITRDSEGAGRLALAPIGGSLGSGMMSMGFYRKNNTFGDGLERSAITYCTYFARALGREYKPDLIILAARLRHKKSAE
jgi:hypothetical protein